MQAEGHATKPYLAVEQPLVSGLTSGFHTKWYRTAGKDRTDPVLWGVRLRCSQSQLEQQPVRTSDKMTDPADFSDSTVARRIDLCWKREIVWITHPHV